MLSGCPNCGGNKFQYLPASAAQRAESPQETQAEKTSTAGSESSVARTVGNAATAFRDLVGSSSASETPTAETPVSPETSTSPSNARSEARSGGDRVEQETEAPSPSTNTKGQTEVKPDARSGHGRKTDTGAETEPNTTSNADTASLEGESATASVAEPGETASMAEEDTAQASARSELVSPDELPPVSNAQTGWEQTKPGPQTAEPQTGAERADTGEEETEQDSQPTERPDLSELRAELNQQFESIKVVEPGQYELNLMELFDRQEYIIALQEDGKYTVQVPEHWQD